MTKSFRAALLLSVAFFAEPALARIGVTSADASLINQQVVAAKLENHKRLWDQWLYERYNMPTLQDERERCDCVGDHQTYALSTKLFG